MRSTLNPGVAVVRALAALLGLSMWLLLAACQTLGPAALGVGRGAYNDVIARTSSEQTLGLLVRLRYSDPVGLLMVSSVTAGLKFTADAKGEAGFGPRANYAGSLVPFSAGIGYEDNPTISYTFRMCWRNSASNIASLSLEKSLPNHHIQSLPSATRSSSYASSH